MGSKRKELWIDIQAIDFEDMKNGQCGDYYNHGPKVKIRVARMSNPKFEYLIAIHELVELVGVLSNNIPIEDCTEFDNNFDSETIDGKHEPEDEPGDDIRCPYYEHHRLANHIERLVANHLEINWPEYEKEVNNLG